MSGAFICTLSFYLRLLAPAFAVLAAIFSYAALTALTPNRWNTYALICAVLAALVGFSIAYMPTCWVFALS
jgi:hypothetical protein